MNDDKTVVREAHEDDGKVSFPKYDTYSLLIWEMVPEECLLYLLPNSELNEVDRNALRVAHTHLINGEHTGEVEAALDYISLALDPEDPNSKWSMHKAGVNTHIESRISHVYRSGFYL